MEMNEFREFMKRDKYAAFSGIELVEVSPGRAVTRMTVRPDHLNGVALAHGGAIFTLADFAFAAACNAYGTISVAINVSISFINAAREGATLTAVCEELVKNPRLGTYRAIITDQDGTIIASFDGLAYRKKDPLPMNG